MSATALYKALRYANVPEDVAEKAVEGLAVAGDVATKKDLADFRTEVVTKIGGVEKEIGNVRTEIAQSEVRMGKWHIASVTLIIGAMGAMGAVLGLMIKFP